MYFVLSLSAADSWLLASALPWLVCFRKILIVAMTFLHRTGPKTDNFEVEARTCCRGLGQALLLLFIVVSPLLCFIASVVNIKANGIEKPISLLVLVVLFAKETMRKNSREKGLQAVWRSW